MTLLDARFETVAEGRRLRVARLGEGPPVVLLHGYPENLQLYCALVPELAARGLTAVALDWPGMGSSDPWPGGATPFHLGDRIVALLDALGIERASLLGTDMGGQPALACAARHPERVERLIVSNSLVLPDERTSWEIRVLRRFGWNRAVLRFLPRIVFGRAERTFLPPGVRLPDDLRADLWAAFRRQDVRAFIVRMCAGYQGTLPHLAQVYGSIARPTLALWGEDDRHFPPAHGEGLAARVPGCRLEVLAGAGHWMAFDRAREVAERVAAFVLGQA